MPLNDKNNDRATNEFNQYVKPVSLWADAWKRLKKNKMAVVGMWIVGLYLAVTFGAAFLPFYSYTDQELLHANLPPSTRPAGRVAVERLESRRGELLVAMQASNREDLKRDLDRVNEDLDRVRFELDRDPVHKRVYLLGTDYLGRDMLARTVYGGQISLLIGIVGTIVFLTLRKFDPETLLGNKS